MICDHVPRHLERNNTCVGPFLRNKATKTKLAISAIGEKSSKSSVYWTMASPCGSGTGCMVPIRLGSFDPCDPATGPARRARHGPWGSPRADGRWYTARRTRHPVGESVPSRTQRVVCALLSSWSIVIGYVGCGSTSALARTRYLVRSSQRHRCAPI